MIDRKIKAHAKIMRNLSKNLGYSFIEKDDSGMKSFLGNFKLFSNGGNKQLYNIVRKVNPTTFEETMIFDYRYVISTGKSTHVFNQTVYMVYSKTFALPHFYMFPEKWYHRFGSIFGIKDIDFVSYPKFSYNYFLKGADEDFIRHTFNQKQIMSTFGRKMGYSLEGCNYVFVLYKHNKLLNYKSVQSLISVAKKVTHAFTEKGVHWLERHENLFEEE
jgi:hypothetical protein